MLRLLFFQPEFRNPQGEIINLVDTNGKAVGYMAYLYKEEKNLYIMGQLDDIGEKQNYIDLVTKYIDGLKTSILGEGENEPNLLIHLGGEIIDIDKEHKDDNTNNKE